MKRLPTYDECRQIADHYSDLQFYERKYNINGYNISVFGYRLVWYDEFKKPLPYSDLEAFELRGITFVFNKDGTLYKRFPLLRKFFNLNQVEESQYHNLKHLEIKNVYEKMDGSIVSFIELPDKTIIPKSHIGIGNDICEMAQGIYDKNEQLREFITWTIENNCTAIFELCSFRNRIVISYGDEDLHLLRVRDNDTGNHICIDYFDVRKTKKYEMSWTDINELHTNPDWQDKEGIVGVLENGYMFKMKTQRYVEMHKICTEQIYRENHLIRLIINEEIDDVIGQIDLTSEIKAVIDDISDKLNLYIKESSEILEKQYKIYKTMNKKDYVSLYGKEWFFSFVIKMDRDSAFDQLKKYILKMTYRLEEAKQFLSEI